MNILVESWKKNIKGIILMLLSSVCACFGQLMWKISVDYSDGHFLLYGLLIYAVGAILMIVAYRFGKLSVLQPMLSFNYVLSLLLGIYILGEKVSILNILGVCVILLGVLFITGGDADD